MKNLNNKDKKSFLSNIIVAVLCIYSLIDTQAQQDPHYTQYMYNTMSVNPAYAGSKGHTTIVALGRTQWVGFKDTPNSQTLSYDTSLRYSGLGLGVNLVNDKIGPSSETYLEANVAYAIKPSETTNLAFGLKLGGRLLNIDWSKGKYTQQDPVFSENVKNKISPSVGVGTYFYSEKWYAGIAVPNFLSTVYYDDKENLNKLMEERMHFYLITGYVFDLNENIKFKPAILGKAVSGAPLSVDVSTNFLFKEKYRAGLAWRWDDSISVLLGFQATKSLHIGYAFDLTTSNYNVTNSGTHEIMLRYEIFKQSRMKSPRFF